MSQNGNAEESISFNSLDVSFDFLEDDTNQNPNQKKQQAENVAPNSANSTSIPINTSNATSTPVGINQLSNIPIGAPSVGIPKPTGINFNAAPMNNPPTLPPQKPSASGSRLLLKKTINKANESSLDNSAGSSQIKTTEPAAPVSTHINNIEELDRDPPEPPKAAIPVTIKPKQLNPPPIPSIPKQQEPPSILNQFPQAAESTNPMNSLISGQSFSQGSSFELFTKMPPVPIPNQTNQVNPSSVSSQPQNPTPGKISVQIKPKVLLQKQQQQQNTTNASNIPLKKSDPINVQPFQSSSLMNSSSALEESIEKAFAVPLKNTTQTPQSQPQLQTQPSQSIQQPQPQTQPSQSIQQPQLQTHPSQPIQQPQPQLQTHPSQPIQQPQLQTHPSQPIQQPQLQTHPSQPIQQPQPQLQTHPSQPIQQPQLQPQSSQPIQQSQIVQLPQNQQSQLPTIEKKDPPKQATIPIKLKVRSLQKPANSQSSMIAAPPPQQQQQPPAQQPVQVQKQAEAAPINQQVTPFQPQNQPQQPEVKPQTPVQQVLPSQSQTQQQPQIQPIQQQPSVQHIQPQIQQTPQPVQQQQQPTQNFQQQQPVQQVQTPPQQFQQPQGYSPSEIQQFQYNSQQQQLPVYQQQQSQITDLPFPQVQFTPSPPQQQQQQQLQYGVQSQMPLQTPYMQQPNLSSSFQFPSPPSAFSYNQPAAAAATSTTTTPPQVVYISTPPPSISPYRPSPTVLVEQRFANSLDRSFSSFKRFFSAEFSMMMRQPSSFSPSSGASQNGVSYNGYGFDFDEYSESLSNEVSQIIESPVPPLDVSRTSLSRSIVSAIDEQTKPLTTVLSESNNRQISFAKTRLTQLKQLREELDSLCTVFKSNAESILKELEGENQNTLNLRNAQIAKQNDLEQRMRTVKLRQVELEAKATHQSVERDSLERQLKQLENRRRDWEDQNGYGGYNNRDNYSVLSSMSRNDSFEIGLNQSDYQSGNGSGGGRYRQRILSEINALRKELSRDLFDDISKSIDEGLSVIRNESDNLKNELIDIDMANRWMMNQIQIYQPVNPSLAASFTAKPNPLPLQMQMQIPVPQMPPQSQTQIQQNASLLGPGFVNTTTVGMSPVKKNMNQTAMPSSPMTKAQMKLNMFRKQREDVVREVKDELL